MAKSATYNTVNSMGITVYHTPAPHASKLASAAFGRTVAGFGAAGATAAVGYLFIPGALLFWLPVAIALIGVGMFYKDQWGKARVGVQSEVKVAKTLAKSNCAQVLINSAMLGAGGDADHVLLGPVAVVVETKTGFGKIRVKDGRVYSGNRIVGKNEVEQVSRQATKLSRILGGIPVAKIICVADGKGKPIQTGGVWVCNADDISAVVKMSAAVIENDRLSSCVNKVLEVHQSVNKVLNKKKS